MKTAIGIIIGIIGISGKYGQWLAAFLRSLGYTVIGSDSKNKEGLSNIEVVQQADVVLFSIPPRVTARVIRQLRRYAREGQLWADVTSMKEIVVAEMPANVEVVLFHPISAPPRELSLRGQTLVVCEVRLDKWRPLVSHIIEASKAHIEYCTPTEHDKQMSIVQGLIHAAALITAAVIRKLGIDITRSLAFASPVYRIALSFIGRILRQDANLYGDIQFLNPFVLSVLVAVEKEAGWLRCIVESQNRRVFLRSFRASAAHFGEENLNAAYKLFDDLNQVMIDREYEHLIALNIPKEKDCPGTLLRIAAIFVECELNMTLFHTFRPRNGLQFLIGFDGSGEVQQALKKIRAEGLAKEA